MSTWGYSHPTHGTAAVGTATGSVLAANPNRQYLRLQNDGTVPVYLNFGTVAELNTGIKLAAGETYEMTRGAANIYSGAVLGIASEDGVRLMYTEGTA